MKKVLFLLEILICFSFNALIVQAAGLNANESAVVSAAQGEFEAGGVTYHVDSTYINSLIEYLSADGVDLTAEQKDAAIGNMYGSVEDGISEGYLVKNDVQENENTVKDNSNAAVSEEKISDFISGVTQTKENVNKSVKKSATTIVDKTTNKVKVVDENSKDIVTVYTVIKNTGFDLSQTVYTMVGILITMVICMIITIKLQFFAHDDE